MKRIFETVSPFRGNFALLGDSPAEAELRIAGLCLVPDITKGVGM